MCGGQVCLIDSLSEKVAHPWVCDRAREEAGGGRPDEKSASLSVLAAGNSGRIFVPMMNRTHSFSLALLGLPSIKVQVI